MKAKRHAKVTSELVIRDRKTKQELHRDSRMQERPVSKFTNAPCAVVKVGNEVKMSMGFQTVGCTVGVDLPWEVTPGLEVAKELEPAFDLAYQLVDDELAKRAKEMEGLLKKLQSKYGHR